MPRSKFHIAVEYVGFDSVAYLVTEYIQRSAMKCKLGRAITSEVTYRKSVRPQPIDVHSKTTPLSGLSNYVVDIVHLTNYIVRPRRLKCSLR